MTPGRETRTPWLEGLPKSWRSVRLKFVKRGALEYGANEAAELNDLTLPRFIRITDIREDGSLREETFRSLPESVARPYLLHEGDILLARSGATVGKAFTYRQSWGRACFAGYLIRVRVDPRKASTEFLRYYTQSHCYQQEIQLSTIQATIQNVSAERYANFLVPLSDVDEQRAIVAFLDRKTAAIDALIAKKERLIALFQEKQQALITQAVTKGLDPNVPMKESGIRAIGEIPAHWRLAALKRLVATKITDGPHETPTILDDGVPFLSAESAVDGRLDFTRKRGFISREDHRRFAHKCLPRRDDILLVKSGSTTGKVCIVDFDDEFSIWSPLALVRARGSLVRTQFLFAAMSSVYFQAQVETRWSFGTQPNIGMNVIENLFMAIPPLAEQDAILRSLDGARGSERFIGLVSDSVARLREYRQAVVTAAVTGKIDVPKEAA